MNSSSGRAPLPFKPCPYCGRKVLVLQLLTGKVKELHGPPMCEQWVDDQVVARDNAGKQEGQGSR